MATPGSYDPDMALRLHSTRSICGSDFVRLFIVIADAWFRAIGSEPTGVCLLAGCWPILWGPTHEISGVPLCWTLRALLSDHSMPTV